MVTNVVKPPRFYTDILNPFSPRARFVRRHHFRLLLRHRRLLLLIPIFFLLIGFFGQAPAFVPSVFAPPSHPKSVDRQEEALLRHHAETAETQANPVLSHRNVHVSVSNFSDVSPPLRSPQHDSKQDRALQPENEPAVARNLHLQSQIDSDDSAQLHLLDVSQPDLAAASHPAANEVVDDTGNPLNQTLIPEPVVKVSTSKPTSKHPHISAVVLFHAEYPTLSHTLESWERLGLLDVVSEFVFFLNGIQSRDEFDAKLPRLKHPRWKGLLRVVPSPQNLALGLAITEMVRLARHDLVILLEKDWSLIEPPKELKEQLEMSVSLLESNTANIVRFRHRHRPGAPLHARIMHEGREMQMLHQQSNLYCYLHHWVGNLSEHYSAYFSPCATTKKVSEPVWCSKARYCQWTNNPGMFYRKWFLDKLGMPFERDYNETIKQGRESNMLDFEYYTNWKEEIWNKRDYVVALPLGLFEHQEVGEQNLMNTVWYAWNRLKTDTEEKRSAYFEKEIHECTGNKSHSAGVPFDEKYPIEFVRLYHYDRAMQRTANEAIAEMSAECSKQQKQMEQMQTRWRNGVTDLTNLWYKVSLFAYPVEPLDMKIGFVTGLFAEEADEVDVARIETAASNINHVREYGLLVYTDKKTSEAVSEELINVHGWDENQVREIEFVTEEGKEVIWRVLTKEVSKRVEKLSRETEWIERVKKRNNGVVPSMNEIGLRLVKPLLLRDAASDSENSTVKRWAEVSHVVWFDANSKCLQKSGSGFGNKLVNLRNDHVLRGHMMLNTMVSGRKVTTDGELEAMLEGSGMDGRSLLEETEVRHVSSGVRVMDGQTFGGSRLAVTLMGGYYDVVMRDMLNNGHLGSEREYLTIAHQNVDYNFEFIDSLHACPNHRCSDSVDVKGCRLFEWAGKCAIEMR